MKKYSFIAIAILLAAACNTDNVLSDDEQLKKDTAAIDKYLAKNGIVPTVIDSTGMRLVISSAGSGAYPVGTSKLTVIYTAKLLSTGAVVDKSTSPPKQFDSKLDELIIGWRLAFRYYIAKGGKATLYIPSGLCYGKAGQGSTIPPNSNLIFDVELVSFSN